MANRNNQRVIMLITPVDDNDSLFAIAQKDIKVLCAVAEHVTVVSGCIPEWVPIPMNCQVVDLGIKLHYVKQRRPLVLSVLSQILKILYIQLQMSAEIVKRRKETQVVLCYLGYHFLIPALSARICGLKVISGAWGVKSEATRNYGQLLGNLLGAMLELTYLLSHTIIVRSPGVIRQNRYLSKWRRKIREGTQYFGEQQIFGVSTPMRNRKNIIGYVGRLSPEKGVANFIAAIPIVLGYMADIQFEIIGRGTLDEWMRARILALDLSDKVSLPGPVPNRELYQYYNRFKVLVIPSDTEGLPNVLLEAISCGTVVVASRVGGIPDIIEDGTTGFLLGSNSPQEIAETLLRVLRMESGLEEIANNALQVLTTRYSFSAAVARFQKIFDELNVKPESGPGDFERSPNSPLRHQDE